MRLLKNIGKPYMQGDDVREVQTLLKQKGFDPGDIDGAYGPITEKAVKAYQETKRLKVDGIVGIITWGSLHASEASDKTPIGRFLDWVAKQVGSLYVWGAQGQEMTETLIKKLENSSKNAQRALASFWAHEKVALSIIAYDCSGLIVRYLLDNGLIGYDTTANGLYFNQCSAILRKDLRGGDLVFKKYRLKNEMYHVGVYMGDGTVVHAKGRDVGVVRKSINATTWNRYGRLTVFALVDTDVVYTRLLKNIGEPYMMGDDVRGVQKALKEAGFDPDIIDGEYGPKTQQAVIGFQEVNELETDGIVGPETWAQLFG